MQCNITFDLDSPEDAAHHLRCTKALDLALCLNEFNNEIYSIIKHKDLTEEQSEVYSKINNLLHEVLEEYGINLTELCR